MAGNELVLAGQSTGRAKQCTGRWAPLLTGQNRPLLIYGPGSLSPRSSGLSRNNRDCPGFPIARFPTRHVGASGGSQVLFQQGCFALPKMSVSQKPG